MDRECDPRRFRTTEKSYVGKVQGMENETKQAQFEELFKCSQR